MKTKTIRLFAYLISALWLFNATAQNVPSTNATPCRVGVYDSRAVAYAFFWSEGQQKQLKEKMTAAQAAKKSGETNRLNVLSAELKEQQAQNHRQVFSTPPVPEALATVKDRLPQIQHETGVANLISKWDKDALKHHPGCEQVDVTDRLVREFIQPNERQQKTIESILKQEPIPLEKCNELIRKGEI